MKVNVGDTASRSKIITDADVRTFAAISGDENPIHLDETFAADTQFGKRIVHGMLSASLISAVLANDLPGHGSIYLGQTLKFKAPVFIGDEISARVTVTSVREGRPIAKLETVCTNQRDEIVIEGEATVHYGNCR